MSDLADFDLTIQAAEGGYTVNIDQDGAVAPVAPQSFKLALDVGMLPRQRQDVAGWVEQARVTKLSAASEEQRQVQAFGQTLFEGLFPGEVRAVFQERRRMLGPNQRLRIRLRTSPELAPIPWELLYDPQAAQFLALMPDIVLARCPPETGTPHTPHPVEGPLQLVVVLASPARYPPINLDRELRWIQQALSGPLERGQVQVDVIRGAGTLDQLRERLRRPTHLLHILCHGDIDTQRGEGFLVFEDPSGDAEKISADVLRLQIEKQRGQTCLVTLNACLGGLPAGNDPFSSVGAALIQGGVPAVIAMQFEIPEESAAELTRVLYAELAAGVPVDLALDEARLSIYGRNPSQLDWAVPVLFTRSDTGTLFEGITASVPAPTPRSEPMVALSDSNNETMPITAGESAIRISEARTIPSWLVPAGASVLVLLLLIAMISMLNRPTNTPITYPTGISAPTVRATEEQPSAVPTLPVTPAPPTATPLPTLVVSAQRTTQTIPIRRFAITVAGAQTMIEVWSLRQDGLVQTTIRTERNGFNPTLSPDGQRVAFVSDRNTGGKNWLYVHNLSTAKEILLTDEFDDANDPAWSPDGTTIVFRAIQDGISRIYRIHAAGGITAPLVTGDARGRVPTWSPDGTHVAFISDRSGRDRVYLANPMSDEVLELPFTNDQGVQISALAWSPDGRYLALVADTDRLWMLDTQAASQPYEVYQASYGIDSVSWSDDGGLVLLALRDRQGAAGIWIANIVADSEHRLAIAEPDLLMGGSDGESLTDVSWQITP